MPGQAGQFQPGGQDPRPSGRGPSGSLKIFHLGWVLLALILLVGPFNRGGLWDPQELRIAELGRRLSHQLFGCNAAVFASEPLTYVTKSQIGQGELGVTSPALGFALFGVSDWAGRVTSLAWGAITIVSLWVVMGRLAGRMAQVVAVLVLATLPLFAWQSRSMLGDAPTIGTLALATTGLLLAHLELMEERECRSLSRLLFFGAMGLVGLGAGLLSRGILIGIAVPTLSVGVVGLAQRRAPHSTPLLSRVLSLLLIGLGLAAAAIGIRALQMAPAGFSFLLGATLTAVPQPSPFATALTSLLHQTFPLSAFLPVGIAIVLKRQRNVQAIGHREASLALVLVFTVVLCLIIGGVLSSRGVAMPFPALAALAGTSGLAVERLHRQRDVSVAIVGAVVLTVAVLLFADFVNLPETVMLTTGIRNARFPENFDSESRVWLGVATLVLGLGCAFVALSSRTAPLRREPMRARYGKVVERIRLAFGGQLLGGFVLVETALGTTALLQRAHERGWITVLAFDSIRSVAGGLLAWAWLLPPVVLFVIPFGYVTLQRVVDWLVMPGWGEARFGKGRVSHAWVALGKSRQGWSHARLSAGLMLGMAVVSSGLVVSLGHAPALAERVSPKRAVVHYRSHARSGEPLALLGLKAESVRYDLGTAPQSFVDIEAAARWLNVSGEQRHWLTFGTERFAELNAAFRAVTKGRNLSLVEPLAGNTVLATSRLRSGEKEHNPLSADLLTEVPKSAHATAIEFGNVLQLVGWDVKSATGESVSQLASGQPYELRFVFAVLGTTAIDWQVFVHLDGRGRRHNGDHEPIAGRYPTSLWQPSDVVVDRHKMVLERGALHGPHVLYFGLFRGNKRLEVTAGKHEDNRVRLGELEVR